MHLPGSEVSSLGLPERSPTHSHPMQALSRILAILDSVAQSSLPPTASDVARETNLSLSTVARLMNQLAEEDLLVRSGNGFSIGPRIIQLARQGTDRFNLQMSAQPLLDTLRDEVGETVGLHIRIGHQRTCIAVAPSFHAVSRVVPVGLSLPLPGSATGEVLLSGVRDADLSHLLKDLTAEEQASVMERIETIRQTGWALYSDMLVEGVTGIGAAVRTHTGDVIAAVSCSGPTSRFSPSVAEKALPAVIAAAEEIASLAERSL